MAYCCRITQQRHSGWNQTSKIWTHQTKGHISTGSYVHCSCFLAQASLFLLLVSFSSWLNCCKETWRPDSCSLLWTVDVEMCLLLEL
jgi:hypothetical protein